MAIFPAILDSCVIYPMYLRDILLCAAEVGLYQVHWTEEILEGSLRNLVKNGVMSQEKARSLSSIMNNAFPEALIEMTDDLIPCMDNHERDRHVLAAALIGKAEVIVTNNIKHFPEEKLKKFNVIAQSADEFLLSLLDLSEDLMLSALANQARRLRNPRKDIFELLSILEKSVPEFVRSCRITLETVSTERS
ncbi:PIN domain-containing protein [Spirulina sp. 06S082]|uniref:PIN domain-containing protein n=1 Tax=Spirulina sp. 06S082 TaxID=3110248 RepID=UPI002B216E28|nr:PIN domain-containing protein [Spirulina sp. 06S082]MEA5472119.1 PIN domain-containing protein [Spirulina sp. 06S082]